MLRGLGGGGRHQKHLHVTVCVALSLLRLSSALLQNVMLAIFKLISYMFAPPESVGTKDNVLAQGEGDNFFGFSVLLLAHHSSGLVPLADITNWLNGFFADANGIRQRRAKVCFSYEPQHEDELALKVGDEVVVHGEDEEGTTIRRKKTCGLYLESCVLPKRESIFLWVGQDQYSVISEVWWI